MKITKATIIGQPDDLLSSKIDDEVIMLGIDSGKYFGLNSVGSHIWELIKEPHSIENLCSKLMDEFEVDEETCLKETIELIEELADNKLLKIENEPTSKVF